MNNPTAFRALRALLATSYPTQEDARRVVTEAGLDQAYFKFSDKAVNNWHNILTEAEKRAGLTALLQIVLEEYQTNPDVVSVLQAYGVTEVQTPDKAASNPHPIHINTVHNLVIGDNTQAAQTSTGGGPNVAGNVTTCGDFVGRDSIKKDENAA